MFNATVYTMDPATPRVDGFSISLRPRVRARHELQRAGWDGSTWGPNQRISVSEALAVNTYNGAWASGEEAIKGSISSGKLADYVVLADDPHDVAADKIKDIQIVRTVGGKVSYQA